MLRESGWNGIFFRCTELMREGEFIINVASRKSVSVEPNSIGRTKARDRNPASYTYTQKGSRRVSRGHVLIVCACIYGWLTNAQALCAVGLKNRG